MLQAFKQLEQDWKLARICVGETNYGCTRVVQFVSVSSTQVSASSFILNKHEPPHSKLQSYCSSWLCLPCPAVLGKLFFFFILRCWKLNPREVKAESWGILRFQSRRVNNKDSQSFFFSLLPYFEDIKTICKFNINWMSKLKSKQVNKIHSKSKCFPFDIF